MALKWQDLIEERKDVMLGKPVFKGTRLTVEHVLRELGTGMSHHELLDNYPNLTLEHIQAASNMPPICSRWTSSSTSKPSEGPPQCDFSRTKTFPDRLLSGFVTRVMILIISEDHHDHSARQ